MKTLLCRFADRQAYEAACPWPFEEGVCQIPAEVGALITYGPLLDQVASTIEDPVILPGYWVHAQFAGAVPAAFREAQAEAGTSAPQIPVSLEDTGLGIDPVPASLTPLQLRMGLLQAGLLDEVEAYIAATPREVGIAWEYATTFDRYHPFIAGAAAFLGLSQDQVDDMFRQAGSIA